LAVWNCVKKLLLISVNGLEHSRGCGWLWGETLMASLQIRVM
jgi:hypothetical protein